jgi:hypothetical protein
MFSGVVRLNLVEMKMDALEEVIKAKHVATIAMPSSQLRAWGEYLLQLSSNTLATGSPEGDLQKDVIG